MNQELFLKKKNNEGRLGLREMKMNIKRRSLQIETDKENDRTGKGPKWILAYVELWDD